MAERIDELEKYYHPIETCEKWAGVLFFVSATLSILILYSNRIEYQLLIDFISIFFILSVVAYSVLSNFNGFYLIPRAEGLRRKQLLSDAFGVPLTPEQTRLYYNNEVSPSAIRLGANVMENSFFAKKVCSEMAKIERLKIFLYILIWLFAIFYRSTNLNLLLTLTQVLFSGEIIFSWIKVEILRSRNELIYDKLYNLFLNKDSSEDHKLVAGILDSFASYESAKASASIKQSSKVFDRLNPQLTSEWEKIKNQLSI